MSCSRHNTVNDHIVLRITFGLSLHLLPFFCINNNSPLWQTYLTLYLIEAPFNIFPNKVDPDQAAGNMNKYYPTLVDLTSNFFDLCTNVVYSYNNSS